MEKDIVEILSPYGSQEAVHRMKIDAIKRHLGEHFDFRDLRQGGDSTKCVLINNFAAGTFRELIQKRSTHAVVMLFLSDIIPGLIPILRNWGGLVDIILVGTPEMRNFLSAFTTVQVQVLFDPIDFCLSDSVEKTEGGADRPLKVVWYGYPESYAKSMSEYDASLRGCHENGEIEYHIVSLRQSYGREETCIVHKYDIESFPSLLASFDVCVLSHAPFSFEIGTFWKSENKAVLAINRGVAVVASSTPAYGRLFAKCGLEDYLFSSNADLVTALRRLKPWPERQRFLKASQSVVLENYSSRKMAYEWLQLYRDARRKKALAP